MAIRSIKLENWRNLTDDEISLSAPRVFLIGENGQGKTNLLEAVYYISYGSSFRGLVDSEISKKSSLGFSARGLVGTIGDDLAKCSAIDISWKSKIKEIKLNGRALRDRKELVEVNPAIVFCHEDFSFASGEPERRRFFFDQTAGLISLGYIDILRDYRKILSQRNMCLREGRVEILDVLDLQLAAKGIELMTERTALTNAFASGFSTIFEEVSLLGSEVSLVYRPHWKDYGEQGIVGIARVLALKRREEMAMKTSISGPHRDRWLFVSEGKEFTSTASTGQLRLLSLILRSSQARYYQKRTGIDPLLLVDDVMLELDPEKKQRFFSTLPAESQAIFTFLPGEDWRAYRNASALVYGVRDGRFTNQISS
jgi:DNA replication and repair protein RecF